MRRAVGVVLAVGGLAIGLPIATAAPNEATELAVATRRADRTGFVVQVREPPPPPPPAALLDPVLGDVLELVNAERAARGVAPVVHQSQLGLAAQLHSQEQADRRVLTHVGADGTGPGGRITATGYEYTTWGENVAAGQPSAEAVVAAWMGSSGHRRNILDQRFTEIGLGLAESSDGTPYWTQVFARPRT